MSRQENFRTKIIGGEFKGKFIEIPNIFTTRSSKGILKESLFNTLQFDIIDKNFVEVFSGSGSIGLEALSRGAGQCYFIEYNKIAYRVLQQNIRELDPSRCHHMLGDSFEKFETVLDMLKNSDEKTYFYFDPPFSTRDGMDDVYDKTIALIEKIDASKCEMVIVEHMTKLDMPKEIGELEQVKRKKFGRSTMTYYIAKERV
ncbi:16S rRNA (guanine(966)-N(2))-methyltransferase RsmD [Sulfurovum sp. bin170]|uniref:16S rRNA (guanine(966)-N(2))-methyltransferase RsmD n=1 Tax=Sulfurovum sp. bin170 TaxID=2695268 RepID=UPI0013E03EB4|nr:16S rRNA (guanine(966)-N(2))-methyltransferase RsmD [Sulfurovum sp. bin170]NEW61085.1 16S rRNA (guanine(966)-N(2))-methyltransferase RsmD [Sulfurovum sp. bin170]